MAKKHTSPYDAAPWFANYDPGVPHNPTLKPAHMCTLLDNAANEKPDNTALIFRTYRLSYRELLQQAETVAANLRKHGVNPGDKVALMMPNMPQMVIAFWGVLKAGGVVVMTNPLYMEKELRHQMTDSGARHMVTLDMCWPKLQALLDVLPIEKYFVTCLDDETLFPENTEAANVLADSVAFDGKRVLPYKTLLEGEERFRHPYGNPQTTLALLQYTGGTTGTPKGVMLSHANQTANIEQAGYVLHTLKEKEQIFAALLPLFHVYGLSTCLLMPTFFAAACVMIPRYDPGEFLGLVKKYKISLYPGAPSVYLSLLQHKDFDKYDLSSLRYGISGSAPIPAAALERFQKISGSKIIEGYGLSESSPITHLTPALGVQKFGSIGLPLPGTDARIVDMDVGTLEMPVGEIGELIIRGPQIMSGYYNLPDETAGALRNGWLYTGDIAYMDEDGYFYIVDRKKDMAIVGGYNVYPREIDDVLLGHPKIKEAVSVAVMHSTRGEMIKAFVVPKDGMTLTVAEVVGYCRKHLASYKVPRKVDFLEALPRAATGKVLRRILRDEERLSAAATKKNSTDSKTSKTPSGENA